MCVVENKTYVHAGNHRETIRTQYRCHNAPAQGLCNYVEERKTESAHVVERRPDAERPSSSPRTIMTAGGREYRYFPLSRRSSMRSSRGRSGDYSGRQSPIDSLVSSSPPGAASYTTVRPQAPSPPPTRATRRVSFHEPPNISRIESPDGTAVYSMPPTLAMPQSSTNESRTLDQRFSISSLANEIDNTEPSVRRPSIKRARRPTKLDLGIGSLNTTNSSQSSPGLSDLPRIYRDRLDASAHLPARDGRRTQDHGRSRDDLAREEDERQARIFNSTLAATEQRQRIRQSREQKPGARKHTQDFSRKASIERRTSPRLAAVAAPAGETTAALRQQEINRELDRKYQAEMEQVERERCIAAERRRLEQFPESPRNRTSARTYTYSPGSPSIVLRPPISARTMTDTTSATLKAKTPRYGTALVHQPDPPRDLLAEQGDRVIQREQARANDATRRMTEMLERTRLEDEAYDDGAQVTAGSGLDRQSSRRYRREERRRRHEGYND